MRLSTFSDVLRYRIVNVIPAWRKTGEAAKVFYYAYATSTHRHTRCSRTGSDRQLKRSCCLGHYPFREAKTSKIVEELFGFSKFWISADKRRSCVIGALFKLLRSLKIFTGGTAPSPLSIWISTLPIASTLLLFQFYYSFILLWIIFWVFTIWHYSFEYVSFYIIS